MQKDDVMTELPQTMLRLAPLKRRLFAFLIDGGMFYALVILMITVLEITGFGTNVDASEEAAAARMNAIRLALAAVLAVGYYGFIPAQWQGQPPGKYLLKLRIVHADDTVPTFSTYVLRNVIGYILSYGFALLGFALAIGDRQNRALHDFMAQTRVVIADRKDKP
ncbi:MAG: RDD family protein [Chloroflexota bacterium]